MSTKTLPELIFERSSAWNEKTVLRHNNESYRYQDIIAKASEIARQIITLGVVAGDFVVVDVERGPACLAAILGVMRSGAVFLPIDTEQPLNRLSQIFEQAKPSFAIASERACEALNNLGIASEKTVVLDEVGDYIGSVDVDETVCLPDLCIDELAYILFTSGSTGVPKGVCISHRALLASVVDGVKAINMDAQDICGQLAQPTFDAAIWEHLAPFYLGATMVTVASDVLATPTGYFSLIEKESISWSYLPPALFVSWVEVVKSQGLETTKPMLSSLKSILFAGESVSLSLIKLWQQWFSTEQTLMNFYGPTETTVLNCGYVIDYIIPEPMDVLPIGTAFGENRIEVLDEDLKMVGVGEIGMMYIGGPQLANGYLGAPALTEKVFISIDDGMFYNSGDLGYKNASGDLVFVGREDNQVKVRGKRIELEEIERCTLQIDAVGQAVALALGDEFETRLVLFVEGDAEPAEVRAWVAKKLPSYMVPHHIEVQLHLPINANGKLDRKKLTSVYNDRLKENTSDNSRDPVESVWYEVLGYEGDDCKFDFFSAGGDSLLLVRALMLLQERGLMVDDVAELMKNNTIDGWNMLAHPVTEEVSSETERSEYALAPMQKEMFTLFHAHDCPELYHIQFVFEAEFKQIDLLELAWQTVIKRHDILRTVFWGESGSEKQRVLPASTAAEFRLGRRDLNQEGLALEQWMADDHQQVFTPSDFPLFRATLLNNENEQWMAVTFFHMLLDGWSFTHLILQVGEVYRQLSSGQALRSEELRGLFSDYIRMCERQRQLPTIIEERNYWETLLVEPLPLVNLPRSGSGGGLVRKAFWCALGEESSDKIKQIAKSLSVTLHPVLLAAYFRLFHQITGQDSMLIGNTTAGRPVNLAGIDQVLGCFISILPVRIDDANLEFSDLVLAVSDQVREMENHRKLPNEAHIDSIKSSAKHQGMHWKVIFALDNFPEDFSSAEIQWPPLFWNPIEPFEVALSVIDLHGKLYCYWNYRADLLSDEFAHKIGDMYLDVLESLCGLPELIDETA